MLQIGFTGTQRGMTPPQRATFLRLLQELRGPHTLHHGDCIGADAEAHDCAKSLGWRVAIHPPIVGVKRAHCFVACDSTVERRKAIAMTSPLDMFPPALCMAVACNATLVFIGFSTDDITMWQGDRLEQADGSHLELRR